MKKQALTNRKIKKETSIDQSQDKGEARTSNRKLAKAPVLPG